MPETPSVREPDLLFSELVSDVCLAVPFAPKSPMQGSIEEQPKIIAPASTLKLVEKTSDLPLLPESDPGALPKGKHWVDMADEGTVVVIEQPPGQNCAAIGGIMAARMKVRRVEGCVVGGRVRDLAELRNSGLPVSLPSLDLSSQP
jgi:regulator of RNase E activity RraA